jgi:dihydroxynaphthoic acid synthetase
MSTDLELTDVLYEKGDGIATVTINRPEVYNALRGLTYADIITAMRDASEDDEIGVIILTGAGDKAFCAGGDVKGQASRTVSGGRKHLHRLMDLYQVMRNCGKPIIAAINGFSIGGGHELHLFCDLSIAAESARLGQVGPRVGSVPIWGATQILPNIVGEKRAREMVMLCHQYTAQEALQMGLVNRVVPDAELMTATREWANELLDKSPQSLRIAKTSFNATTDHLYSSYLAGMEMLSLTYGNAENMEGVHAFLDKRQPDYRKFRRTEEEPVVADTPSGS